MHAQPAERPQEYVDDFSTKALRGETVAELVREDGKEEQREATDSKPDNEPPRHCLALARQRGERRSQGIEAVKNQKNGTFDGDAEEPANRQFVAVAPAWEPTVSLCSGHSKTHHGVV